MESNMKPKIYLETTIISYLTAFLNRDLVTTAHQQIIQEWEDQAMSHDTIVDEVRRHRNAYAKGFNYDLQAIYQDLIAQQKKSGRKIVSLTPRPVKSINAIQH